MGGADLVPTGDQAGSLTEETFTPTYRGDWLDLWLHLGDSERAGFGNLNSEVPTSPTDYSAVFAAAQVYFSTTAPDAWKDLAPEGDGLWGPELASCRDLDAAVAYPTFHLKTAINGSILASDWPDDGTGTAWANLEQDIAFAFDGSNGVHLMEAPRLRSLLLDLGTNDASLEVDSANLNDFLDRFPSGTFLFGGADQDARVYLTRASDYIAVIHRIPTFSSRTWKANVNTGIDAAVAARSDLVSVNTDAMTDNGDSVHYDPASQIARGVAEAAAWVDQANKTA